jgi:DNA-binding NarL/FixJ family response regulator
MAQQPEANGHASQLSQRETEVLALVAHGLPNSNIAAKLDLTVHAVKFHLASIYRKLHVTNRTEAAVRYLNEINNAQSALGAD